MSFKRYRAVLIALSIGFLIVGALEWKRTTFLESYWLLLLSLVSLLTFQYLRLRNREVETARSVVAGKVKPVKKSKGRRNDK